MTELLMGEYLDRHDMIQHDDVDNMVSYSLESSVKAMVSYNKRKWKKKKMENNLGDILFYCHFRMFIFIGIYIFVRTYKRNYLCFRSNDDFCTMGVCLCQRITIFL